MDFETLLVTVKVMWVQRKSVLNESEFERYGHRDRERWKSRDQAWLRATSLPTPPLKLALARTYPSPAL